MNTLRFTRRRALQAVGMTAASCLISPVDQLLAAEEATKLPSLPPLNRFSRMVHEYFVEQVKDAERRGLAIKQSLKTKADAEQYVKTVREKILQCFGPLPEKTPLNARVTGELVRDAYKIEKVIFESRPEFYVTGNLYLPNGPGRKGPFPGVIGSCGHSTTGKGEPAYQSFAQGLARMGYAVFLFDPIGQGERLQYTDMDLKPRLGVGVAEHLFAGNQQSLVGEFLGTWRAWDGIRALDYLLSRSEVDPKHIGVTGNSGGGTMTTWLCGLEPRWTMAAPSCFVTTFRRNMENELPADTEQCPPKVLAAGLDHDDFLAAMAPKPVIIMGQEKDYFDVRGSAETFERLKRLYTLLGAPDNVRLHIGPREHGYSQENREAMYGWFNRAIGSSQPSKEPELTIEKNEDLLCTPKGQVAGLKSRTVFSFTQAKSKALAARRKELTGASLRDAVVDVLRLGPSLEKQKSTVPEYRILRAARRNYPRPNSTHYAVETEPNVFAVTVRLSDKPHLSRLPQDGGPAILYVAHHSADVELRESTFVRDLLAAEPNSTFYAVDVRGVGESRPDTCGADSFRTPYGSDYFYSAHSIMLDRPYVGQKTLDVLRVLDLLAAHGHRQIHLAGHYWGSISATFAGVLSPHVSQVTLNESLKSYASIAESEEYSWPLSSFVRNILEKTDLPDCYNELQRSKKLVVRS